MSRQLIRWTILGAALVGAACSVSEITDVRQSTMVRAASATAVNFIECPTSATTSATALITPLGGVVSTGGTTVSIPAGAVLAPTTITVTVPASNLMEIDVSAAGVDHFVFQQPITVTLSYARCTRNDIDKSPLSVWYIDSVTKAAISAMGGVDDKIARTVTFITGHLSGYAIANRSDTDPPPEE